MKNAYENKETEKLNIEREEIDVYFNVLDEVAEKDVSAAEFYKDKTKTSKRRKEDYKKKSKRYKAAVKGLDAGWVVVDLVDGKYVPIEKHAKYRKNSNLKKFYKKQTHHKNRKYKIEEEDKIQKGNKYKRCVDLAWNIY